ncbi:GNAT family N-acetyltransferase [Oceanobacillus halophilus]|nr:GNAT family N-acetyltransferase [Oceanobacillus halophilus]
MQIFKLTIDDIEKYKEEIVTMLKQSFEKSFPELNYEPTSFYDRVESLKVYLNEKKALVYGSEIDESLAGFVWFFEKDTPKGKLIHINHFVVDENFRRRGLGNTLWNMVEEYASKRGIEEIELLVTKNNENAVNFYLNRNFEVERLVMKKRLLK